MILKRLAILLIFTLFFTVSSQAQDVTSDLLGRINTLRQSLGVAPYSLNGTLSAAAQNQAEWMASSGQVSHTQPDGSTPRTRASRLGYPSTAVSENIYMGSNASAGSAWEWWLNSPIHYRGITNTAYTEVGIGWAAGAYGQAFVLVFGNPNGWGASPARAAGSTGSSSAGGSAAAAAPSFVVGIDPLGNIMHEIQAGDTLGDIAFMYGYGWDDLEYFRQINNMTEAEGRNLKVGAILLVPPWEGTYTPTPGGVPEIVIQVTPGPTENAIVIHSDALEFQGTATSEDLGILASSTPSPSPSPEIPDDLAAAPAENTAEVMPTNEGAAPTQTPLPTDQAQSQSGWRVMTFTPTPAAVAIANTQNDQGAQTGSAAPAVTQTNIVVKEKTPLWLIGAVILQTGIIIGAGLEWLRRRRKR